MYKFMRIACALIISTLIMALSPVYAEESGTVEFTISCENIDHEGIGFEVPNEVEIAFSGLEPNKQYTITSNDGIGTTVSKLNTDSDGSGVYRMSGVATGDIILTINGVSQLSYSINYPQLKSAYSRHQFNMEVYHNDVLTETVVGERNKGIQSKTYTVNAGSKEKILLKNNFYKAFSSTIIGGISDRKVKYTARITGLEPEDLVFFMPRIRTMTLVGASIEDGVIAKTRPTNGEVVYDFEIGSDIGDIKTMDIYSIPAYAKLTVTQHEVGFDYTPNYQTVANGASDNTVPGIELSTPELGYIDNSTYQTVVFTNMQTQTVVVNKTVEGNQGNRHEQFNFTAKFTTDGNTDYTGAVTISKNNGAVEQITPDSNNVYTFKLQHGDTVKLFGFEDFIQTATITEADNDYQTKVAVNSGQPTDGREATVTIDGNGSNIYSGYIRYINSKSLIVPTGISLPVGGALFIIVGIGIIFISKRHKQVKVI